MDAYDGVLVPEGFGLNNTGVICYFNSLLQLLASCPALTRALLTGRHASTSTGRALTEFFRAFGRKKGSSPSEGVELLSSRVLAALVKDLRQRRPNSEFGAGQQSASEALVLLLEMADPPGGGEQESLSDLFYHRYRCELHCPRCKRVVSTETDVSVHLELFHMDAAWPRTAAGFSEAVREHRARVEDYLCEKCGRRGAVTRVYRLSLVPDILVCVFNVYVEYGGFRRARPFPPLLAFPAADGGDPLIFRLVAQVEHAGGLSGGHYWARGLRAGGRVFMLNDTGVSPSSFACTDNTYLVAYHYAGRGRPGRAETKAPAGERRAEKAGAPAVPAVW